MILSGLRGDWWLCAEASQADHCFWVWEGEQQWRSNCQEDKETPKHPSPSRRAPLGPNSTLNALAHLGINRPRVSPAKTNKCSKNGLKVSVQLSVQWACTLCHICLFLTMAWHIYLNLFQRGFVLFLGVCLTYRHKIKCTIWRDGSGVELSHVRKLTCETSRDGHDGLFWFIVLYFLFSGLCCNLKAHYSTYFYVCIQLLIIEQL